jgi:uncharacterized protein
MNGILYIAAKAPRPGLAKTRLGAQIGHLPATTLYRAFLQDLAAQFADAPFPVGWYITPADCWGEIRSAMGSIAPARLGLAQPDGSWAQRQRAFFRDQAPTADRPIILIASDSPQVTIPMVRDAFHLLERHDLVLGPVTDGGYWLIGMRTYLDVFDGISMSTATVVRQISARASQLGASLGYAASTFDVDTREDLRPLVEHAVQRKDLPATRLALKSLDLLQDRASLPTSLSTRQEPLLTGSTGERSVADGD